MIIQGWKEAEDHLKISTSKRKRLEKIIPAPKIKTNISKSGGVAFESTALVDWIKAIARKVFGSKDQKGP